MFYRGGLNDVRLDSVVRRLKEFPPGADRIAPVVEGSAHVRPPSTITYLHHDGTGLLFVILHELRALGRLGCLGSGVRSAMRVGAAARQTREQGDERRGVSPGVQARAIHRRYRSAPAA